MNKKAILRLSDGTEFHGESFGYEGAVAGEVVFNTAMMGYPESLTDPSYAGQILVMTFPLVGNYGVPSESTERNGLSTFMESDRIHVRALVVSDYSVHYSHWNAKGSLAEWLKREKVVGITGIDTRELTKRLREYGSMSGVIITEGQQDIPFEDPNLVNQVALVSTKEVEHFGNGSKRVCLVDMGVKQNIIRELLKFDVSITVVPWDYDFNTLEWDGLFISNGPGNPELCTKAVEHLKTAMEGNKPIFGICMGNQLLARAAGATTYKLKYGHRSHNQPVRMVGTDKCFITSQNHGFAVDSSNLGKDWEPLFVNMNDGTNEGIRHKSKPFFSAQFHPEATSGPTDTEFLFDQFINLL